MSIMKSRLTSSLSRPLPDSNRLVATSAHHATTHFNARTTQQQMTWLDISTVVRPLCVIVWVLIGLKTWYVTSTRSIIDRFKSVHFLDWQIIIIIIYWLWRSSQTYRHTNIQNMIQEINIKDNTKNTKKTYTADAANVFHTDFLIKDTELSNR